MGIVLYFLLATLIFEKEITGAIPDEKQCSRFEYEYKILERIIFLENRNNELEKKQMVLERKNEELVEIVKEQRLEMERKDSELVETMKKADSNLERKLANLTTTQTSELQQVRLEMQQLKKEQTTSHVALETDLNKKFDKQNAVITQLGTEMVGKDNAQSEARSLLKSELEVEDSRLEASIRGLAANLTARIEQIKTGLGSVQNNRIGFSARLTKRISSTSSMTVVFDRVVTNAGDAYNATTGIFKAPVKGLYLFSATHMSYNRYTRLEIFNNNDIVGRMYTDGYHGGTKYDQSTNSVIVDLQKDDEVSVKLDHTGGSGPYVVHGSEFSSFSGVFVG